MRHIVFNVYYSNDLDVQKEILLKIMENTLDDPFQSEVVLVQSPGMAQWLKWQIAQKKGIASNIKFPMPASFIWQQYLDNLPQVEEQSQFNKTSMTWRFMRLVPNYLSDESFSTLRHYLAYSAQSEQYKLYQLVHKIADLFDQYLVYRPEWLKAWESGQDDMVVQKLTQKLPANDDPILQQIVQDVRWQASLWRALVQDIQAETQNENVVHRAYLHTQFLSFLQQDSPKNIPKRLFIFGISALPIGYLETFKALSYHCDVHLFFTNGCREYWGDLVDHKFRHKLAQMQRISYYNQQSHAIYQEDPTKALEQTATDEEILEGHPLLSIWGKLGRDFLYLLTDLEQSENVNSVEAYTDLSERNLLSQVQARILRLDGNTGLNFTENDHSLTFHSCHSPMREVEVLQDYLLHLFQNNPEITPKDVVVMVANIDRYTPYIQAVFGQKKRNDKSSIPFSISDNKLSENDVLIASFIHLLKMREAQFTAEEVLALLDIPAIRNKFQIDLTDLEQVHHWVVNAGIRFGLEKTTDSQQTNYNSWQAGLERMLLGYAMREENGIWQDSLGFDNSYGLGGQLAGKLAEFITCLSDWYEQMQQPQLALNWQENLTALLANFFDSDEDNSATLLYIQDVIEQSIAQIQQTHFAENINIDVIADMLASALEDDPNTMRFLAGKVNFCTLLPMRSIPFKVVCLLGMNDGEYPRQQTPNSFDLMKHDRRKGDRFRRDDDCYLFLEALLSAQEYFYVSFVGRSIIDNQAKEPSVLVSQLLDYVAEKLAQNDDKNWREHLVQQHPMTAFSPENFTKNDRSFAKQWLPLANRENANQFENFIQPIEQMLLDDDREIRLSELIDFVQNPVAFFFKRRLGVYLTGLDESIADTENFSLDALEQYQINDALLYCDEDETDTFFAQLKIKGALPRGEFANIYANKQKEAVQELKEKIADYLQQDYQIQSVDLPLKTSKGKVRLVGNIDRLYYNRRVSWRVGSVKDKHCIESWIYYLAQCAMSEDIVQPPIYYGKNEEQTFKPLEMVEEFTVREQAINQLLVYIESYLQTYQQLQIVPTTDISSYLDAMAGENAENSSVFLQKLKAIAEGGYMSSGDVYWKRVFDQQQFDDNLIKEINERTKSWFALMIDHLE